jgi:hydroxyacylglutathione hydrolase
VNDGDELHLESPSVSLRALHVPGHTLGHVAYVSIGGGSPMLFCGDTLFASGCGRLLEGTAAQMSASLSTLASLPCETLVYCAHEYTLANIRFALAVEPDNAKLLAWAQDAQQLRLGNKPTVPTTIAHELCVNPFMRCDQQPVIAAAQRVAGTQLGTPAAVLAVVRAWKDRF